MTDAGPPVTDGIEPVDTPPRTPAPKKKRSRMMADPVVRGMTAVAVGLVIVFLLVALGVLLSGVTAPTGPRSLVEKELAVAREAVRSGKADPETWQTYISALVANGRYRQARTVLNEARSSIDDSATASLSVAEVRLLVATKDYKKAIKVADKAQKDASAAYQAVLDAGGQPALSAKLDGLPENWYILSLLKAEAYRALGDWAKVVAELDTYIEKNPEASDILVDRGNAKVELKDNAGAEADFRKALKFVPDDPEALAGLKKIGAATND